VILVAESFPLGRATSDPCEDLGTDKGLARGEEVAFLEAHVRLEQRSELGQSRAGAGFGGREVVTEGAVFAQRPLHQVGAPNQRQCRKQLLLFDGEVGPEVVIVSTANLG